MSSHFIVVGLSVHAGLEACDACRGHGFAALALAEAEELLSSSTLVVMSVVADFQEVNRVDPLLRLLWLGAAEIISLNLVKDESQSLEGH
jgi:hypothetical protein